MPLPQKDNDRALSTSFSRRQASFRGQWSLVLPIMRSSALIAACLCLISTTSLADSNLTTPLSSRQILPDNFKPPQVFENFNLLRNINLEKSYIRETINVIIQNVDVKEQDTYYIPFKAEAIAKVGGLEVRDKKDIGKPAFRSEFVEYDLYR